METRFINVGYGNLVAANRVVAVVTPDSAPIKRIVQDAKEKGLIIDTTCGRKTRAVIIMDTGNVVLSSVMPDTVGTRIASKND